MNSRPLLLVAIFGIAALAGCLNQGDDTFDTNSDEPAIPAGTVLGYHSFSTAGDIPVGLSSPDGTSFICADQDINSATYLWDLPTHYDGVPATYSEIHIEVEPLTPSSFDLDLFVYDAAGVLIGSNTDFDVVEGPPQVNLASRGPGELTVVLRNCLGAASSYSMGGIATASASSDVFEDPINVFKQGDQWYAVKTLEYDIQTTNQVARGSAQTGAGFIAVRSHSSDHYMLTAELTGRGSTEQEARDRLAGIRLAHNSMAGIDSFILDVEASTSSGNWQGQQADLSFEFPAVQEWTTLELDTAAGGITVQGIDAQSLNVGTSAGAIDVRNTRANVMNLDTSAGAVTAQMRESTLSGSWRLDASAGALDLQLIEGGSFGYDIEAQTSAGQVTFNFQDAPTIETDCQYASCYKHAVTNGYAGRAIQVEVDLETSAGFISARS